MSAGRVLHAIFVEGSNLTTARQMDKCTDGKRIVDIEMYVKAKQKQTQQLAAGFLKQAAFNQTSNTGPAR